MSEQKALISLSGSLSGAKMTLTNPETGEGVVLNLAPSKVREVERVFPEDNE